MKMKNVIAVLAVAGALAAVGCEEKKAAPAPASNGTKSTLDKAKEAGTKAVESTKDAVKEGADKAKEAGAKAADSAKSAVDDAAAKAKAAAADALNKAKEAGTAYLGQLNGAGDLLAGVKTADDAKAAQPKLDAASGKLNEATGVLDKLTPELKTQVKDALKSSLEPATKKFKDEMARLMGNKDISAVLGDTLKKFKLFE